MNNYHYPKDAIHPRAINNYSWVLPLERAQTSTLIISLSTQSGKVCTLIHLLLMFMFLNKTSA